MIDKLTNENVRLKKAVLELSILNEFATQITSLKSVDQVISTIVEKCIKHINVEQAVVVLLEKQNSEKPFQTMIRKVDLDKNGTLPLRLNTQLIGWILKTKKSLIVNDLQNDVRFKGCGEELNSVKSLLGVPLIYHAKLTGILTVFNKMSGQEFTEDDKRLLSIISSQSAQIIENARLIEEEKKLIAIKEELRMAREIQKKLLPISNPNLKEYDISGINIPAKEIGGDYYDFISLGPYKLALCLGDITGKGLPAAMLMSNLQATFRGQIRIKERIKECIKSSNSLLYHSTESDKFATFFGAIINMKNNTISYCNAGHNNPICIKNNKSVVRLNKGGLLLGFLEDNSYEEETIEIEPGELIVIFSDGITEAMDENYNEFGEENLIKVILDNVNHSSDNIIEKIISEIKSHARKQIQTDDITIIVIKRK